MAKRQRGMTERKIVKWLKEGRGQGIGAEYKPWLTIQDVPSIGCASRIFGWKTNRIHHCMSKNEKNYLYCLDWADDVLDIREQFPLSIDVTMQIATEIGVSHPRDPRTKELIVMTTDFLITVLRDGRPVIIARTIKPKKKLMEKRVQQKLLIERIYWARQGIDWGVITDEDIPLTVVKNIEWLHNAYWAEKLDDIQASHIRSVYKAFKTATNSPACSERLSLFLRRMDETLSMNAGTALKIIRHLLARKIIKTDITRKIVITDSLSQFEVTDIFVRGG
ncbi:MAG: TnsA endonuclease N-terminal domain-containing protein [Negativicutes bacterium]|nr:TnsA endonuclease N-terminal domain-containing protein [Negativicutes bacterium]